jgi:hypothetical protein
LLAPGDFSIAKDNRLRVFSRNQFCRRGGSSNYSFYQFALSRSSSYCLRSLTAHQEADMWRTYAIVLPLFFFLFQGSTRAQEVVVPAGTLLHCTLDEPNFSSATAEVGDPVLCYLRSLQQFGRTIFPRGSYLQGHLEAAKEPGHFFGKGYIQIQFDRIGLPNTDMPIPSKVILAHGFKVDRQGDIVGHGHAKRDAVEWMIPPLWPWKVVSLPARGPRPTLKGEEPLTLRLMEDVVLPRTAIVLPPGWHFFGEHSALSSVAPAPAASASTAQLASAQSKTPLAARSERVTRIALRSYVVFDVAKYRIVGDHLDCVLPDGQESTVELREVNWRKTSQLNAERAKAPILEASLRAN